jgi:hypothetical protein
MREYPNVNVGPNIKQLVKIYNEHRCIYCLVKYPHWLCVVKGTRYNLYPPVNMTWFVDDDKLIFQKQ